MPQTSSVVYETGIDSIETETDIEAVDYVCPQLLSENWLDHCERLAHSSAEQLLKRIGADFWTRNVTVCQKKVN